MFLSPWACSTPCVHSLANTGSINPPDTHLSWTLPLCMQREAFTKLHLHVSGEAHTYTHMIMQSSTALHPGPPSRGSVVHVLPLVLIPSHPSVLFSGASVSTTAPRPLWSWSPTASYCQVPWSFASLPGDSPCWFHSPWVSSSLTG